MHSNVHSWNMFVSLLILNKWRSVMCIVPQWGSHQSSYKWIKWWKALFKYACDVEIDRWWVKLLTTYHSIINDKMLKYIAAHVYLHLDLVSVNTIHKFWDESISCGPCCGWNALGIWTGDPGLITLCHKHCNIQHLWGSDLWAGNHIGHSCFLKSIRGHLHIVSLEASHYLHHFEPTLIFIDSPKKETWRSKHIWLSVFYGMLQVNFWRISWPFLSI